ncbi:hypothetical protein GXP67_32635 [Rhodocytophaga rosea]|uniref:Lipoprotein n=1 Tax=Rhodocytophaga rosea TaxID=2704465 RepID=A0A6C0GU41_9BACT|nr:hypothetical protein [Rhodocytophaga rosea]QHT71063.1 hypothetical protein GXP67_32635 [Rhodocytophaga rosea]
MKSIRSVYLLIASFITSCSSEKETITGKFKKFNIEFKEEFYILENSSASAIGDYSEKIIIHISPSDRLDIQQMFKNCPGYTDTIPGYRNDHGKEEKTETAFKIKEGYYYELFIPHNGYERYAIRLDTTKNELVYSYIDE